MKAAHGELAVDGHIEDAGRLMELRARLDVLNHRLLEILETRGRIVQEVMAIKQRTGMPRHDPKREAEMIASLLRSAGSVYPDDALKGIFEAIFTASRQIAAAGPGHARSTADEG